MPPRYARGRSPPTSPQEGAMNSIVEKGASKVALFLLALQSSFLCGLFGCALTRACCLYRPKLLSRRQSHCIDIKGFSPNLFYYLVTLGLTFHYNHIKLFHKMLYTSNLVA
ncbi:MAG TPA: hypothetical protein P5215_05720 [Bacteroidales bacterium]|nr:hypothetical protein [Bacteroidales bacterium]